jgi:hypothetical protein
VDGGTIEEEHILEARICAVVSGARTINFSMYLTHMCIHAVECMKGGRMTELLKNSTYGTQTTPCTTCSNVSCVPAHTRHQVLEGDHQAITMIHQLTDHHHAETDEIQRDPCPFHRRVHPPFPSRLRPHHITPRQHKCAVQWSVSHTQSQKLSASVKESQ